MSSLERSCTPHTKATPCKSEPSSVLSHDADSNACPPGLPNSRSTIDANGHVYPEGGLQAWSVVVGGFFAMFASLGLVNTIGTFQAYLQEHQLRNYSPGSVGWISGTFAFLTFFGGVLTGPVFDTYGPRILIFSGSVLIMVMTVTLGFCSQYWHFMVSIGLVGGVGASLLFTPAIASTGHYFYRRRGVATGLASTGGSVGGIVYPIVFQSLIRKLGFAWTTRVMALISLIALSIACLLVRTPGLRSTASKGNLLPDFRIFRQVKFLLTAMSIFFIEWGLFVPISYITTYAVAHQMPSGLAYQLLAILNAGSFFGRWIPGHIADSLGRFNTLIITIALCLLCVTCLWLPAGNNMAMLIAYCVTFGFASGSNICLAPVCIGQLCNIESYGRYCATAFILVSFG